MTREATTVEERLNATFGVWLMLYPHAWQRQHAEEARAILVDRTIERGGRVSPADIADLIWHAFAARLDNAAKPLLTRLPPASRAIPAVVCLLIATVGSVIMIVGEAYGAAHRPTLPKDIPANVMFLSGPFLTIGVGLDIGFIATLILFVAGLYRSARIAVLATTVFAIWISLPGGLTVYPHPPQIVSGVMAVLGLLTLAGLSDRIAVGSRRRVLIGGLAVGLSAAGVGASLLITGRPGWAPEHPTGSLTVAVVLYGVSAAVIVITIGAALSSAARRRRFGPLLMVMIAAILITGLHAIAATVGSDPQSAWLWPALCLAATIVLFARLRRTLMTNVGSGPDPASADPNTTAS